MKNIAQLIVHGFKLFQNQYKQQQQSYGYKYQSFFLSLLSFLFQIVYRIYNQLTLFNYIQQQRQVSMIEHIQSLTLESLDNIKSCTIQLTSAKTKQEFCKVVMIITGNLNNVQPTMLLDPNSFLLNQFKIIAKQILQTKFNAIEDIGVYHEALKKLFVLVIKIHQFHRIDEKIYETIKELLIKDSWIFKENSSRRASPKSKSLIDDDDDSDWGFSERKTQFYYQIMHQICLSLCQHPKVVWNMDYSAILETFKFFNFVYKNCDKKDKITRQVVQMFDLYLTELHAYFLSGRSSLMQLTQYKKLQYLIEKMVELPQNDYKYDLANKVNFLGVNLALCLIKSETEEIKEKGIKLLDEFTLNIDRNRYKVIKQQLYRDWLEKNQLLKILFSPSVTPNQIRLSQNIIKYFKYVKFDASLRLNTFLGMLKDQRLISVREIIYSGLDLFKLDDKEKLKVGEFITSIVNYDDISLEYLNVFESYIRRLINRDEALKFLLKIEDLICRYFQRFNEQYQIKITNIAVLLLEKIKEKTPHQDRSAILIDLINRYLENATVGSTIYMNRLTEQKFGGVVVGNNLSGAIETSINKYYCLDKMFTILQKYPDWEKYLMDFFKFVGRKCDGNSQILIRYLKRFIYYPQVYRIFVDSVYGSKLHQIMNELLKSIETEPIPFQIIKLTFLRLNTSKIERFNRDTDTDMYQTNYQFEELQFGPQLIELIQKTNKLEVRRKCAIFYADLISNRNNDKSLYAENHILLNTINQTIENCIKYAKLYLQNQDIQINKLVGNLQILFQLTKITDVLGVGDYPPHESLVTTSTVSLKVVNNLRISTSESKHLQKVFPSNITLFQALRQIGLVFKCGPEELSLKKNQQTISIRQNGTILEKLNLSGSNLIALQNKTNKLPLSQYMSGGKLTITMQKCIESIFSKFSFNGKMSMIEYANYYKEANNVKFVSEYQIKQFFEQNDKDDDGIITLPDFINHFRKKMDRESYSSYYSRQILENIFNLHYRKNFTYYNEELNITDNYINMVRAIISNNSQFYMILFKLSQVQNQLLSEQARNILMYFPSLPSLISQFDSQMKLLGKSDFFIYYLLIMIYRQLNQQYSDQNYQQMKGERIKLFIKNKNDEEIFKLLDYYYKLQNKNTTQNKSLIICFQILRSLINIEHLDSFSMNQSYFDPSTIPALPPTDLFTLKSTIALQNLDTVNLESLLILQLTQPKIDFECVIRGCFHYLPQIRKVCCNFLYCWQIKTNFQYNLFEININQKYCNEWFNLLSSIIATKSKLNIPPIYSSTIQKLLTRCENLSERYDEVMHGYLKMLLKMIQIPYFKIESIEPVLIQLLANTISPLNRTLIYQIYLQVRPSGLLNYHENILQDIFPSRQCLIRDKFLGIQNLGSICYMSSILQQFFMISKFKHLILKHPIKQSYQTITLNGRQYIDDFYYQLQKMYYHLELSQKKYYNPYQFCLTIKDIDNKPISTSIQQDSHQFLSIMLDKIQKELKKYNKVQELQNIIAGKTLMEITCLVCNNKISKVQQFYNISLEVKGYATLDESLKRFTAPEEIQDYYCQKCEKKVKKIVKQTYITELPQNLIFNLKRIIFSGAMIQRMIKVHSKLQFPLQMDVRQYVKSDQILAMPTKYSLRGVVVHTGSSQGGHYYSLIKTEGTWYNFNDQNVVPFDEKQIQRQCYGGFQNKDTFGDISYSTNAYILIYEKTKKSIDDSFIDIQNQFTAKITHENSMIIRQLQIHQESFFISIQRIYQNIRPKEIEQQLKIATFKEDWNNEMTLQFQNILSVFQKAIQFISVFTGLQGQTKQKFIYYMSELYYLLPEATFKYIQNVNSETLAENIIGHVDPYYRQILAESLIRIVLIFIRYYGVTFNENNQLQNQKLSHLLNTLINIVRTQYFYSNLIKSQYYFKIWCIWSNCDTFFHQYFSKTNFLFVLLDLTMGKESKYKKGGLKVQDVPSIIYPNILTLMRMIMQSSLNCKGKSIQSQKNIQRYKIAEGSQIMLYNWNFYKRMVKFKYDSFQLTPILVCLCYEDISFTSHLIQSFLYFLNTKSQIDNYNILFSHISNVLLINDSLSQFRYSSLLGVPQFKSVGMMSKLEYCLNASDHSDYVTYLTGFLMGKDKQNRHPLLEILYQERRNCNQLQVSGLKCLLTLMNMSEQIYRFVIGTCPKNYHMLNYFDWIPETIKCLMKEKELDFIIQNKAQSLNSLKYLTEGIESKIKQQKQLFPIQKYIIGKNVGLTYRQKIELDDCSIQIIQHETYALNNQPYGDGNKSMPKKYFSQYDPKSIGNCFIDKRSKLTAEDGKTVDKLKTVITLKVSCKKRLLVSIKTQNFKHKIVIDEGQHSLNLPYFTSPLTQVLQIKQFNNQPQQELQKHNSMIKLQEVKCNSEPMIAQIHEIKEGVIICKTCTFENTITSLNCDMCENALFEFD